MRLNCIRSNSTQGGFMPKKPASKIKSDPLLRKKAHAHSYLKWLKSQEGMQVAAGTFKQSFSHYLRLAKQDDNFNAADRHEEQQQALNENPYQQDNDEAMKETDPKDWKGSES